jgi:hypothetical protein
MEFRILGPLEAWDERGAVALGASRGRCSPSSFSTPTRSFPADRADPRVVAHLHVRILTWALPER